MTTPISPEVAEGLSATPFGPIAEPATEGQPQQKRAWPKRDLAKTSTYAVMHFCVAVTVAYILTWDIRIALGIGLIEPLAQTVAYVAHERGWTRWSILERIRAWPMRDLVKTGTYAAMHFCVAMSVAYVLTWDIRIALGIGLIEPLVQTAAYALHERGWARWSDPAAAAATAGQRSSS